MKYEEQRKKIYSEFNIDFEFLYHNYRLDIIPLNRLKLPYRATLTYYCEKVRALNKGICRLEQSGLHEYFAKDSRSHFKSVLGVDWENRVADLEGRICVYYKKFVKVYNEIGEENEKRNKA